MLEKASSGPLRYLENRALASTALVFLHFPVYELRSLSGRPFRLSGRPFGYIWTQLSVLLAPRGLPVGTSGRPWTAKRSKIILQRFRGTAKRSRKARSGRLKAREKLFRDSYTLEKTGSGH